MAESQKSLETITKFEADRLVNNKMFIDKLNAVAGGAIATLAGVVAPLWNYLSDEYKARVGHQILEFQKLFPVPENVDYDKIITYVLASAALAVFYFAGKNVHSAISSRRQYKANPEGVIRENYGKEIA